MTDPILQMLAYELAGIFAALSLWLILRASKKQNQVQADAAKAVKKLKRLKDQRLDSLNTLLAEKYGLVGEALSQTTLALQEHEQQIYKSLLTLFVEQNGKALSNLPSQVEKALNAGLDLLPVGVEHTSSEVIVSVDNTKELQEQIEENTQKLDQIMMVISQNQSAITKDDKSNVEAVNIDIEVIESIGDTIDAEEDEADIDIDDIVANTEVTGIDVSDDIIESDENTADSDVGDIVDDIVDDGDSDSEANPVELEEEDLVSVDDIDALLENIDVEIEVDDPPDDEAGEGIDLAALDEEEDSPKKIEAESVVATADSANSNQQQDKSEQSIESDTVEQESVSEMDLDDVADNDINELTQVDNVMDELDTPETEEAQLMAKMADLMDEQAETNKDIVESELEENPVITEEIIELETEEASIVEKDVEEEIEPEFEEILEPELEEAQLLAKMAELISEQESADESIENVLEKAEDDVEEILVPEIEDIVVEEAIEETIDAEFDDAPIVEEMSEEAAEPEQEAIEEE
ncbi:MAG: hypothetical protein HRT92_10925, partial [Piscirickettsiaceae bacterium]|nr:hypothetical protein [Piscirickettsiaceae bacterium]